MEKLKEYKMLLFSGLAVLLFLAAAYGIVGRAEPMDSQYTYAEHLFREDVVNEINIEIDETDWQDMLENPLEEAYYRADVTINGETIGNVAIRTKGNNSLTSVANSDSDRYSFKLDFDYYEDGGSYYGLKKLCLNNNYGDSSNMREYISYHILEGMGIPTPACGYSHITINGEEWGLYLAVEAIDEVFLATHFADDTGDLYKPDGTGADLVYQGEDISVYTGLNLKTNLETSDGSEILALMQALEGGEGLEDVLDVDEALRYLAVNVALANYDSYLGGTTHNYYLYEENGVFSVLPWDYNYAFGGFGGGEVDIYEPANNSMGGGQGGRMERESGEAGEKPNGEMPTEQNKEGRSGEEQAVRKNEKMQMPAMEAERNNPFGGSTEKPLVTTLLENEEYLAKYEKYLRQITETYFSEEYMTALVTQVHDLIAPYVVQDATAFYTYEEFEQACSVNPEDSYSLVYYAKNMSESILNQLAGGEPTFDASGLKGGGMGGGMHSFDGEKPEGMPDLGGEMPMQGEQPDENGEKPNTKGMPEFGGKDGAPPDGMGGENGGMRGGFGGRNGEKQIDLREYFIMLSICGGIFAAGSIFLLCFQRKKELKPPQEKRN